MAGWRKLHVIELMNTLAIDSHCAEGARRAGYGALAPKPRRRPPREPFGPNGSGSARRGSGSARRGCGSLGGKAIFSSGRLRRAPSAFGVSLPVVAVYAGLRLAKPSVG